MNDLQYKGFFARIQYDPRDQIFTGRLAGIRAIVSFEGKTPAALEDAFHLAVDGFLSDTDLQTSLSKITPSTRQKTAG